MTLILVAFNFFDGELKSYIFYLLCAVPLSGESSMSNSQAATFSLRDVIRI